jgi:hypothetical protein
MGVSGQRHAPAMLQPPGKGPRCTHCTGGWTGPRAGLDREVREKTFASARIKPRSPCCPARSQTLHWLSYLAPSASGYYIGYVLFLIRARAWVFGAPEWTFRFALPPATKATYKNEHCALLWITFCIYNFRFSLHDKLE